jgi:hypothetical protein
MNHFSKTISCPLISARFLCLTEKKARGVEIRGGGEKGNGPKNKNCFQFKIDYIKYDAKNLKMETVVQLEKLFI